MDGIPGRRRLVCLKDKHGRVESWAVWLLLMRFRSPLDGLGHGVLDGEAEYWPPVICHLS